MPIEYQGMEYLDPEEASKLSSTDDFPEIHAAIIEAPMGSTLGFNLGPNATNEDALSLTGRYSHPYNINRLGFRISQKCGYDGNGDYWLTITKRPPKRRKADR